LPYSSLRMLLRPVRTASFFAGLIALAACSTPDPARMSDGVWDPDEAANRRVHAFNKKLDRAVLAPAGKGYVTIVPAPVVHGVSNFSDNLSLPGTVVNNLLQLDLGGALTNTARFAFNTVVGVGGVFDPAGLIGLHEKDTDFGQTLAVWGAPEGSYLELPVLGPSTQRAATGKVVDLVTNPLSYALPDPEKYYGTGASVLSKLGDRGNYGDALDDLYYNSADSYAAARSVYMQNRRFNVGAADGGYDDPYADPYGSSDNDPYIADQLDPYEALSNE